MKTIAERALGHVEHLTVQIGSRPPGAADDIDKGAGLGDKGYARKTRNYKNRFDQTATAINTGGVGPFTDTTVLASIAGSSDFEIVIDEKVRHYLGEPKVEPLPSSHHFLFCFKRTPGFALTSKGIRNIEHT